MAWEFVGVSNEVAVATTAHALVTTGISGTLQAGDLLVACITSRIASTTSITLPTGGEWTLVAEQKNNNVLTTNSALPSGMMAYCVRGASTPNLTFTHPVAPSQAQGRIVAYRNVNRSSPKDTQTAFTTATAQTAVTGTGLTTTQIGDLIVAMACGGQEAAWSAFNATNPAGASGATVTTAPTTTWSERADSLVTTGADGSLAIFDAVKLTSGATGNLTATASVSAGHVVIAGAFKITARLDDAWNVEDKSAGVALSSNDKTATFTTGPNAAVRSTTKRVSGTVGKYYAEISCTNVLQATGNESIGVHNATLAIGTASVSNRVLPVNGNIQTYGGTLTGVSLGAFADGDTLCIAWDAGAELIWFRRNNGLWNNSGSADPATGTGGLNASATPNVDQALWAFAATSAVEIQIFTLRTESAEFSYYGPVGFTSWMGEVLPTAPGVGDADGTSTAAAIGAATAAANASTAGGTSTATATGTSSTILEGAGDADGIGAATATGSTAVTVAAGDGTSAGTGAASAIGTAVMPTAGAAVGTSTAAGTGGATNAGVGDADGTSTATGSGNALVPAVGDTDGISAANATGSATGVGIGDADATSGASATGVTIGAAAGDADGIGATTGTGRATSASAGTAPATSTANATGRLTGAGIGAAAGIGAGAATAIAIAAGVGTAAGLGEALALSAPGATTGTSDGIGAANAVGGRIVAASAVASGVGAGVAVSETVVAVTLEGIGLGAGVGDAAGVSFEEPVLRSAAPSVRWAVTSFPVYAHRIITTLAEDRVIVVLSEQRTVTPVGENRTIVAEDEDRVIDTVAYERLIRAAA